MLSHHGVCPRTTALQQAVTRPRSLPHHERAQKGNRANRPPTAPRRQARRSQPARSSHDQSSTQTASHRGRSASRNASSPETRRTAHSSQAFRASCSHACRSRTGFTCARCICAGSHCASRISRGTKTARTPGTDGWRTETSGSFRAPSQASRRSCCSETSWHDRLSAACSRSQASGRSRAEASRARRRCSRCGPQTPGAGRPGSRRPQTGDSSTCSYQTSHGRTGQTRCSRREEIHLQGRCAGPRTSGSSPSHRQDRRTFGSSGHTECHRPEGSPRRIRI